MRWSGQGLPTPRQNLLGLGRTYTEQPPLALRVTEDFLHRALPEREDGLAGKLVCVPGVERVAGLGHQQDVGEEEEHPALQLLPLGGHHR